MLKSIFSAAKMFLLVALLTFGVIYAQATWSEPTATPPGNNTDAPVNVGSTDQIKSAGLGVDQLAVYGNASIDGYVQIGETGVLCDASVEDAQRYDATDKEMQYCNGTDWASFGSSESGGSVTGAFIAAVSYTGTGANQVISGFGFSPNLIWLKSRGTSRSHSLMDSTRGWSKVLSAGESSAQYTGSAISVTGCDGFTLGTSGGQNVNGESYMAYGFEEGVAAGLDIVSLTKSQTGNETFEHNLATTPAMIIVKNLAATQDWRVWHEGLSSQTDSYLKLNTSDTAASTASFWGAAPSSADFTLGANALGWSSADYIAYVFAEKAGVSSFGSYSGNGSSNGPTITTGFTPKVVLIKRRDASGSWILLDSGRNPSNPVTRELYPDNSSAEVVGGPIDFEATGFKVNNTSATYNASGGTYVYAAFAE